MSKLKALTLGLALAAMVPPVGPVRKGGRPQRQLSKKQQKSRAKAKRAKKQRRNNRKK